MKTIKFGKTGLEVPAIGLGCMRLTELEEWDIPKYIWHCISLGVNFFLPSPDPTDEDNVWEYAETNAQGIVTKNILLAVPKLKYCFAVYDRGSNEWITKDVELVRGTNEEIEFVVNK